MVVSFYMLGNDFIFDAVAALFWLSFGKTKFYSTVRFQGFNRNGLSICTFLFFIIFPLSMGHTFQFQALSTKNWKHLICFRGYD